MRKSRILEGKWLKCSLGRGIGGAVGDGRSHVQDAGGAEAVDQVRKKVTRIWRSVFFSAEFLMHIHPLGILLKCRF